MGYSNDLLSIIELCLLLSLLSEKILFFIGVPGWVEGLDGMPLCLYRLS